MFLSICTPISPRVKPNPGSCRGWVLLKSDQIGSEPDRGLHFLIFAETLLSLISIFEALEREDLG